MSDEEELYIDPNMKLKRVYDYLPYSHWRIKRILEENFNYRLENLWAGYKGNRYSGYKEKYRLINNDTGEIVNPCITLDRIRHIFANAGIPLHDEESNRNQGAQHFLETVNEIKKSTKED